VRRGFLIIVGIILIVAVVVLMWWLPAYRENELQKQISAIESMEDLTAKKEAALDFLLVNQMSDRRILLRALDAAVEANEGEADKRQLVDLYQQLYEQDLTSWLHYRIMARLDRGLMEIGTPESVERAEGLARDLIEARDAPMEPYQWMVYYHSRSDLTNPELTLQVALAAEYATDRVENGGWPRILGTAYSAILDGIMKKQGLDAALSHAELLGDQTESPQALAALDATVYDISVTDDKERAVEAATAMSELEGLTAYEPLNRVAYDMAERGLAPDIAVTLSEMALMHTSSAYDSVMVLDTVGWSYYAAGEPEKAAEYLRTAVNRMDETLTMDNEIVQHLLTAYDSAGMRDEEIDLLARIASRSVDADDPARRRLRELLIERDGNADAMDSIIAGLRYEGVEMAPAFDLPDRSGRMVSLDSMRGDIIVLCFWSYG
jgi:tetratricopeptide (TPR) repeat protein